MHTLGKRAYRKVSRVRIPLFPPVKIMYKNIIKELELLSDKNRAEKFYSFFMTKKGGYGEGDEFLGLTNPLVRGVVKKYKKEILLSDIEKLLQNKYHEIRLAGVLFLVEMYARADMPLKKQIVYLYLKNVQHINNWDLVDLSVYKILGNYCLAIDDYSILYHLSETKFLWAERMSVVANWIIVKRKKFDVLLTLSKKFLSHKHDLMHKAVGWILREMGKSSDEGYNALIKFLDENAPKMPRTMLRYSIERLPQNLKQKYMNLK